MKKLIEEIEAMVERMNRYAIYPLNSDAIDLLLRCKSALESNERRSYSEMTIKQLQMERDSIFFELQRRVCGDPGAGITIDLADSARREGGEGK